MIPGGRGYGKGLKNEQFLPSELGDYKQNKPKGRRGLNHLQRSTRIMLRESLSNPDQTDLVFSLWFGVHPETHMAGWQQCLMHLQQSKLKVDSLVGWHRFGGYGAPCLVDQPSGSAQLVPLKELLVEFVPNR